MTERMIDPKPIVINVLIATTMFSLGFGASQLTLATDVHTSKAQIIGLRDGQIQAWAAIKDNQSQFRQDLDAERKRTDDRIYQVVGLMDKVISQNTEMITLIRVQQQTKTP